LERKNKKQKGEAVASITYRIGERSRQEIQSEEIIKFIAKVIPFFKKIYK